MLFRSAKVDVSASCEGIITRLPFREGDEVEAGDTVALLENSQIELAVGRARNGVAQARAALSLAEARLFEGRLAVESRMLEIGKSRLALEQARREVAESERKQSDIEALLKAGGVPEETARAGRFALMREREKLAIMGKDLEIQLVGLRDEDMRASGIEPPEDAAARKQALVRLSTAGLEAETAAAAARLEAARKDLESALVSCAELTVKTPCSGVIVARYVESGERAKREDKLVTVMDIDALYAVASVGEADAMRLEPGMKALVNVDGACAVFEGTVDLIAPIADAGSASCSVRVAVAAPRGRIKPGMFARMSVATGPGRRVLVVPESALAESSGKDAVLYAIAGGIVSERRVVLGESLEKGRVVESGVAKGEVVVDCPAAWLKDGDHVTISG